MPDTRQQIDVVGPLLHAAKPGGQPPDCAVTDALEPSRHHDRVEVTILPVVERRGHG